MHRKVSTRFRDINGVLLLDKPLGISSNQALQRARKLFQAKKAGHTGSLDPMASGLLPVCFGEATKISAYLLDADKHYQTTAHLGSVTDTGDATGTTTSVREVPEFSEAEIELVLQSFRGDIQQIPPMYSALHHHGKRLYELAREGREVEREPRNVTITSLNLLQLAPDTLVLDVHCSKGTYIRTLVEDIGEALGCGAHVAELRRLSVAPFQTPEMLTLDTLEVLADKDDTQLLNKLIPMDVAISHWPSVHLDAEQTQKIIHGQSIYWEAEDAERLRIYDQNDQFIGIGQIQSSNLKSKRLLRQDTEDYR